MKKLRWLDAIVAVAIVALALMARGPTMVWANSSPGTGMAGSAHDFSSRFANFADNSFMNYGMCTRCHTPHRAITTLLLWNHTLTNDSFHWDEPTTTAGTNFPTFAGDTYKGPTAKCLSCHDGSVATRDINWFNEQKPVVSGSPFGATSSITVGYHGDMKGTHPVAMPYPYSGAPNTYNGSTTGTQVNFVEYQSTPITGIRLYNDSGGSITQGPVSGKSGIECTSCHDVHNSPRVVDDFLLVGMLSGNDTNYICLKCHIK